MVMVMPTKESPVRALLSRFFSHFPIGHHVLYVLVKHTVPGRLLALGSLQLAKRSAGPDWCFFGSAWVRLGVVRLGQVRPRGIVR